MKRMSLRINFVRGWKSLCFKHEKRFAPLLKEFARSPMANRLSQAALETLSIIAYKQPVTRSEIDELRGTIKRSSSNISSTTADRRKGRVDGPVVQFYMEPALISWTILD